MCDIPILLERANFRSVKSKLWSWKVLFVCFAIALTDKPFPHDTSNLALYFKVLFLISLNLK